jgi:hypothetical protein
MTPDTDPDLIQTEFSASWDRMEQFFAWHSALSGGEWLKPMLNLIATLRQQGYDRQFRAGQSLDAFVLSRSKEHGLRSEQPRVAVVLNPEGGMTVAYQDGSGLHEITVDQVELTPEVEALLQRLLAHPID